MSVSVLLERIDDWINPIVVKELRQAVKSRVVVSILMLFLGLQLFLLGVCIVFGDIGSEDTASNWNAGNLVFRWQQGILLFTLMMMVPAYAAVRLGAERSDTNVDLLFISTLHPRSIIAGKFFAALVLAMLVFSTCAPFMTFTYLLRGIDIPTILVVLACDLLLMLFSTMIALFLAAVPGTRAIKVFLAFLGFIFLGLVFYGSVWMTIELIVTGTGFLESIFDFWTVTTVVVLAILGLVGLFYVYSVALISPHSSNRILPVRIYFLGLWLVMGTGLFLTSYYHTPSLSLVPVTFWVFGASVLLCVQLCISICERERWGPRVAKTIPTHWWLRPLAFLFYTGSAGGIVFTGLLMLATLGSAWWWVDQFSTAGTGRTDGAAEMLKIMSAICLYFFCYGLSAVLVRTHILAGQLRSAFNWLVGLLLVGLGSSIPSVIAYVFFSDQMRQHTDGGWWMLPNPFMAIYEIGSEMSWGAKDEFQTRCFWFLGIWAAVVIALTMPWMFEQLARFHRPRKREVEYAPVTVVEPVSSVAAR